MSERALTDKQPWADLIMADDGAGGCLKPVENRTWSVPSTVLRCPECGGRGGMQGSVHWGDGPVPSGLAYSPCPYCDDMPPDEWANDHAFPFRLWIHAGLSMDRQAVEAWERLFASTGRMRHNFDRLGVLLGSVLVTGCHHADDCATWDRGYCSGWAEPDRFHWTLTDPQPLVTPIPMRGRQGLWTLPDVVVRDGESWTQRLNDAKGATL